MSDTLSAVRSAAAGGVQRSASARAPERLTRADGASRVAAIEESFGASALRAAGIGSAGGVAPVSPVTPFGGSAGGQQQQQPDDDQPDNRQQSPNGRGLLGTNITTLLAETRGEELAVAAADPGRAELARATSQYRETARRIIASGPAA